MVGESNRLKDSKNLLFVNKKKQKNFVNQGCIRPRAARAN